MNRDWHVKVEFVAGQFSLGHLACCLAVVLLAAGTASAQLERVGRVQLPTNSDPRVALGNLNGDSYADLVVSAPGTLVLYLGGPGGFPSTPSATRELPTAAGPVPVALADVDGDRLDDVIVGQPAPPQGAGKVVVLRSLPVAPFLDPQPTTTLLPATATANAFGWSLATGDFNGDGQRDVLVGEPRHNLVFIAPGRAYVFFGPLPPGNVTPRPGDRVLLGQQDQDWFGFAVAAANVIAGGGDDAVIGSPGYGGGSGRVEVFRGTSLSRPPQATITGSLQFGRLLAAGDVDGNTFADLAVGRLADQVHVFLSNGSAVSPTPASIVTVPEFSSPSTPAVQSQIASADITGDGLADLILGAPAASVPGAGYTGKVHVFAGRASPPGVSEFHVLISPNGRDYDNFGSSVAVGKVGRDRALLAAVSPNSGFRIDEVFLFAQRCSYSLSHSDQWVPPDPNVWYGVGVSAPAGCPWTAASNVAWIHIQSGSSGNGNGQVTFSVAPNATDNMREGSLTIAGLPFTVRQCGRPSISPTSAQVGSAGGSVSISLSFPGQCVWGAISPENWITLDPRSGRGSHTLTVSWAANTSTGDRTGTATIAGRTFTLTQRGVCQYSILPPSAIFGPGGGTGFVDVTASATTCPWGPVTASVSWITITNPGSGMGNGRVSYSVAPNPDPDPRSGQLIIAGLPHTVNQAGLAFGPPVTVRLGSNPRFVATGDFNSDSKPDLAVAKSSDDVQVLLGDGSGGFQPAGNFPVGRFPIFIAVGDYNFDSWLDLAVANHRSDDVSVLLGNGDGTFQPALLSSAGVLPSSIAVGHFNDDGIPDLAVSNMGSYPDHLGTVSILLGNGDGTFSTATELPAGRGSSFIAVADLNGDGRPDLAVTNWGHFQYDAGSDRYVYVPNNVVTVLLGGVDGTFQAVPGPTVGDGALSLAAGDFNRDGRPDLATANSGSDSVTVLLGNGDGTFGAPRNLAVGRYPNSLAVADVNPVSNDDLVVVNGGDATVSVLLGRGDGDFQTRRDFPVGGGASSVAVSDFNRNGLPDLAVANFENSVWVLAGRGDGTFPAPPIFTAGSSPRAIAAGDFNGDGWSDLAVAKSSDHVAILLRAQDGSYQVAGNYRVGRYPISAAAGDFNNDTYLDLAIVNHVSANVAVLLGNSDGTFQPAAYFPVGIYPASVAVADLNGDLIPDLAVSSMGSPPDYQGTVWILTGDGNGSFSTGSICGAGGGSISVAVGHFNSDEKPDLAVANWFSSNVSILLGRDGGGCEPARNFPTGINPYSIVVSHLDSDGLWDVATANAGSNNVSVLRGRGDGTLHPRADFAVGTFPNAIISTDFDRNGKEDLAVTNGHSDTVSILFGAGDATYQPAVSLPVGFAPNALVGIDLDRDGKPDLAVGNFGSYDVTVLANRFP